MSQFRILGRRPLPFKAIPIRFAYTNFPTRFWSLSAVHRPLPPQRVRQGAEVEADEGRQDVQGHPCTGVARGVGGVGCAKTLAYTNFPMQHWAGIRKNNASERLNRKTRRRTRVVGAFPDGRSALMLVTARLKYIVENEWGRKRHLDASLLEEKEGEV